MATTRVLFGLVYKVGQGVRNALWYMADIVFLTATTYVRGVGKFSLVNIDVGSLIVVVVSVALFLPWAVASRLPKAEADTMYTQNFLVEEERAANERERFPTRSSDPRSQADSAPAATGSALVLPFTEGAAVPGAEEPQADFNAESGSQLPSLHRALCRWPPAWERGRWDKRALCREPGAPQRRAVGPG